MKKWLICLLLLMVTGCGKGTIQGYLSNTCKKTELSNGFTEELSYQIDFKESDIYKVIFTKRYHASNEDAKKSVKAIRTTIQSEDQFLTKKLGLQMSTEKDTDDEYIRVYELDLTQASEELRDQFGITKNRNDQVNRFKEKGFVCK